MTDEQRERLAASTARLDALLQGQRTHLLDHLHTDAADVAWDRAVDERLDRLAEREGAR